MDVPNPPFDQPQQAAHAAGSQRDADRLWPLAGWLTGNGLEVHMTDCGLVVRDHDRMDASVVVVCRPRTDDGNRPWFFSGDIPITEADCGHLADAAAQIRSLLTRSRS